MAANQNTRTLTCLIREIIKDVHATRERPSLKAQAKYFRSFAQIDYSAAVAKHFDRPQLGRIFGDLRRVLPTLNQEIFKTTDLLRLTAIAARLGVLLHAEPFDSVEGRALRGFYIHDREILKRPLICVNLANHPVAVAAAFWHEMGHHLTNGIFDENCDLRYSNFSTNYQDHFDDPREVAADMVLALAGYPSPAATTLFGGSPNGPHRPDLDLLLLRAQTYVRSVLDFEFEPQFAATENLSYLAGIIHVAKLRATLLNEYGI
jgi:hypothetical protein